MSGIGTLCAIAHYLATLFLVNLLNALDSGCFFEYNTVKYCLSPHLCFWCHWDLKKTGTLKMTCKQNVRGGRFSPYLNLTDILQNSPKTLARVYIIIPESSQTTRRKENKKEKTRIGQKSDNIKKQVETVTGPASDKFMLHEFMLRKKREKGVLTVISKIFARFWKITIGVRLWSILVSSKV